MNSESFALPRCRTAKSAYALPANASELITIDPKILGGTPVFRGNRLPVQTLFQYLESNYSLEEFLECFPTVTRQAAVAFLALFEIPRTAVVEAMEFKAKFTPSATDPEQLLTRSNFQRRKLSECKSCI